MVSLSPYRHLFHPLISIHICLHIIENEQNGVVYKYLLQLDWLACMYIFLVVQHLSCTATFGHLVKFLLIYNHVINLMIM
jgi:hypothetical protein